MNHLSKKWQCAILSLAVLLACMLPLYGTSARMLQANAVSADYPAQLMNIASKDNSSVLTENGTKDNSTLSVKALGGDLSAAWRFDRVRYFLQDSQRTVRQTSHT